MAAIKYGEDLKVWFDLNGCPFWKLRESREKNGRVISSNFGKEAVDTLEQSYERLDTILKMYQKDEGATLWLNTKKENNEGGYSNEINVKVVPAFLDTQIAGIGNINTQMQPAAVNIGAEIARAKKEWDLERKLEDLEAQINAPQTDWITRGTEILNGLMQNPIIAGFAAKIAGLDMSAMAQVSGGEHVPDHHTPVEESDDLDTALEIFNETGFSDSDLLKLAKFVKRDPKTAKNLFNQLGQQ